MNKSAKSKDGRKAVGPGQRWLHLPGLVREEMQEARHPRRNPRGKDPSKEVRRVGDALAPRRTAEVIYEGETVGREQ